MRGPRESPRYRRAASWVALGLAGVLLNLLLTFRLQIVATQSFLSMLLLVLGLSALVVGAALPLRVAAIGLHLGYFAVVWIAAPLFDVHQLRWDVLLGWLVLAASLVAYLRQASRGGDEGQASPAERAATANV